MQLIHILVLVVILYILTSIDAGNTDIEPSVELTRRICKNNINCGVQFNDISGKLHKYVKFEVEYISDAAAFAGSVWVSDCEYPRGGYLLFVLFGPPEKSGLYKLVEDKHKILSIELVVLSASPSDVAWSKKTPNDAYITSLFGQEIFVVDLQSGIIRKTYGFFEGKQFAGPDGLFADDEGNIYFTDTDFNVNPDADPDTTLPGGNLFRIDAINDKVYLEGRVEYGYNGIALNNYGNGKRLVAANTVDLPDDIYDFTNNAIENVERIFIDEFIKRNDGSLRRRGRYYSITENIDRFPMKTFLDGIVFDAYDNLYVAAITNQTMSRLVVLHYSDCSDISDGYTEYIGEIIFKEGFGVTAITLARDGYFYASLLNFPDFTDGEFVRFRGRGKNAQKKHK